MDLPKFKDVVTLVDSENFHAAALASEQHMYWATPGGVNKSFYQDFFNFTIDGSIPIDGHGPVHRTISTAQQGTPLGRYCFESNGNQFYLFRTLSNLWLSYSYLKSEDSGPFKQFEQQEFVFLPNWRDAAVFSYVRATYELDSESAPFVDEGETVQWTSPDPILFLQTSRGFDGRAVPPVVGVGPDGLLTTRPTKGETKQGPMPPLRFQWHDKTLPRTVLVPAVLPDAVPVINVDQVAEDDADKAAWAALSDALQASKLRSFPEYPEVPDWHDLGTAARPARNETVARLRSWGLNAAAIEKLDLRELKRHHVSRLALDPALSSDAHQRVRELLLHYIDIRDDLEVYLGRIRELVQARFTVQDNVIEQIAIRLGNVDLGREEASGAPAMTVFTVINAIAAIPGAVVPQIGAIVATVNLALALYSEYEAAMERADTPVRDQSSLGLNESKATLLEQINRDFIRTGYAVDRVQDSIASDPGALQAWRDANAIWPVNTDTLDHAINSLYRKFVWAQLMRAGCVLSWEKYDERAGISVEDYENGVVEDKIAADLQSRRREDPSIVALRPYISQVVVQPFVSYTVAYCQWRLKSRTGDLSAETMRQIIVDQGWTPESLWNSSGIKIENLGDLHGFLRNHHFIPGVTRVADLTRTEAHEILSRLKPAQNTDSA